MAESEKIYSELERCKEKYDKNNTVRYGFKLNKNTDNDIIEYLNSLTNKQGYIKSLIREDLIKKGINK